MQKLDGRRGAVFPIRIAPHDLEKLQALHAKEPWRPFGPWIIAQALAVAGAGNTRAQRGNTAAAAIPKAPIRKRIILDLCAGSGAWSEPYRCAGYDVRRISLPNQDVRTFRAPPHVWGVLAAPPCDQFSLARNGHPAPRRILEGLEVVHACLALILLCRPRWWALENPVGLLSKYLGPSRDVFQPHEFGDPWTKRTAIWGDFVPPARGPHVKPVMGGGHPCTSAKSSGKACSHSEHRAITPPGFARAFFAANP